LTSINGARHPGAETGVSDGLPALAGSLAGEVTPLGDAFS
jgi:hypothetical protein